MLCHFMLWWRGASSGYEDINSWVSVCVCVCMCVCVCVCVCVGQANILLFLSLIDPLHSHINVFGIDW